MASSITIFIGGLALITNSLLLITMAFLSNIILAPIMSVVGQLTTGPQPLSMGDTTFIVPLIWGILILFEIVCIISFVIVASRRSEVGYEEQYL